MPVPPSRKAQNNTRRGLGMQSGCCLFCKITGCSEPLNIVLIHVLGDAGGNSPAGAPVSERLKSHIPGPVRYKYLFSPSQQARRYYF
jgi:hypothetical protein